MKKQFFQDDDSFWGKDQKTSTRFDQNFSITDFLKINLGTKVGLNLVSTGLACTSELLSLRISI